MEPLVTVSHGNATDIARGVDLFARFYQDEFRDTALTAFVNRQRMRYLFVLCIAGVFMAICVIPYTINSASIFAILLFIMGAVLFGICIVCLTRIVRARTDCEKNLATFFDEQFSLAKMAHRSVYESRFYDNHAETLSGEPTKRPQKTKRHYKDVICVYETDDIYFFQGVGWVPKERLSGEELSRIKAIIDVHFMDGKYKKVSVAKE